MRRTAREYKRTRKTPTGNQSGRLGLLIRLTGNIFIALAALGLLATFGPALFVEAQFRINQIRGVHFSISDQRLATKNQKLLGFGGLLNLSTEQVLTAPDPQYSIIIPKIGAAAKVIPNVDPVDQNQYVSALQKGIAMARGTVYPDSPKGTTFLFAHSTDNFWDVGRYNAVFYLLKDLNIGDQIVLFYNGLRYNYQVVDTKIVSPEDVGYLNNAQNSRKQLVLQTCWPPGTTWNRVIVVAYPALPN